jgi:signal transduction histidine kinase
VKRLAQDTSEVTASPIGEMRRIAAALRPAVLEDLGLLPTLRWYARGIEMRYGVRAKLISLELRGRLNPSFETTIY